MQKETEEWPRVCICAMCDSVYMEGDACPVCLPDKVLAEIMKYTDFMLRKSAEKQKKRAEAYLPLPDPVYSENLYHPEERFLF